MNLGEGWPSFSGIPIRGRDGKKLAATVYGHKVPPLK